MNKQEFLEIIKEEKLSTGFKSLDEALKGGFSNTDFIILGARPAMGKTSLALNIAQHIVLKEHKAIALFYLEMSKKQLMQRMFCTDAELDNERLRTGNMQACDWEKLVETMTRFAEAPLHIDDTSGCTIEDIISKCRSLATKENRLSLIIIDYLQLIEGGEDPYQRFKDVEKFLMMLKSLTYELNTPILCLSQLSRRPEKREDKRPNLTDWAEQIAFDKYADIVLFIYRDDYYTPIKDNTVSEAEIIIAKNRDNYDISTAKLNFKRNITKFEDIEN